MATLSRREPAAETQKPIPGVPASGHRAVFRSRSWFAAPIVAAALVPVAVWGWVAFETRAKALAAAQADERRITEALGEHTLKLLEAQAFALDLVDREAGERDCPALRSDGRAQDLVRVAAQSPQTRALWIINADGFLCMASDPARMDDRSRSFREYFIGRGRVPGSGVAAVDK